MKHLFLIGMPGCGKSYVARHLSRLLHRPSVDLDDYMVTLYGQSISEMFAAGEVSFRVQEQKALVTLIDSLEVPSVLAMGGGTPAFYHNIKVMKANGVLLWLDLPISALAANLIQQPGQRPILNLLNDTALKEKLAMLYQIRAPYYQQANWKINTTDQASLDTFVRQFNEFLLQDHG